MIGRDGQQELREARRHAVVLGAGIAGLLAARILSDHFDQVTIVERDALPAEPAPRTGAPQGRHVHGLLARGHAILEQLFPGLDAEFADAGAPLVDWTLLLVHLWRLEAALPIRDRDTRPQP